MPREKSIKIQKNLNSQWQSESPLQRRLKWLERQHEINRYSIPILLALATISGGTASLISLGDTDLTFTITFTIISLIGFIALILLIAYFIYYIWIYYLPISYLNRRRDIHHNFNPFISEAAVKDPDMFFGRQEILADILENIHATNFAIFGPKRIGKTSLLHQIEHGLSRKEEAHFDYLPLLISLHAVPESRFFRELMRKIGAGLKARGRYPAEGLPLQAPQSQEITEPYDETSFYEDLILLRAALEAQSDLPLRLVLLVDEGDALNHYRQETLAALRSIFMVSAAGYLKIVLTAEAKDNRAWELTGSPWFSIFGKQYQLTPFTPAEARQLIEKPVPHYRYQPEAIDLILERCQLVPRHIQNICRQAVAEMLAEKSGRITRHHVEIALNKLDNLPETATASLAYPQPESLPQQTLAETKEPYQTTAPEKEE